MDNVKDWTELTLEQAMGSTGNRQWCCQPSNQGWLEATQGKWL